jgi:hypothetical protein
LGGKGRLKGVMREQNPEGDEKEEEEVNLPGSTLIH